MNAGTNNARPFVIVTNAGTDTEKVDSDFPTHAAAVAALTDADEGADVMKRLPDGTLTTEF
jgi:hypothetical protein